MARAGYQALVIPYEWVDYHTAFKKLTYDSNRTALWELDNKIKSGKMR